MGTQVPEVPEALYHHHQIYLDPQETLVIQVNLVYLVNMVTLDGWDHKGREAEREHQAALDKEVSQVIQELME